MNKNETFEITDEVIEMIVNKYDEIGLEHGYDHILIAFKEIHERGIKELKDRIYAKNPYNFLAIMGKCTDDSPRTIQRICNKK